ncbi:MAG: LPPG:FO 2-phospho-L-lactate transferase [Candidatus Syntrophoarchaeum caldarius]|uniref:2-phospho-L-lactate transferase n=1 Tax=Candidatus Syntropharchaeum caldarium TaxID=1838285 RepID=A0A1F2P9P2_9EURY|nr:MAG: LPPG:FO 2-phospho-L-lactate transferase [Candidatus Syntrophoarchaeum caldarius]
MILLSGGTGTPKLIQGLMQIIPAEKITAIVNTADDMWVSGNLVSPDVDTVLYTFAGIIDDEKWWGIKNDSFRTYERLKSCGHGEEMMIGDLDRATHILRSELIRNGVRLTDATSRICAQMGIRSKVLPMSDAPVSTIVATPDGDLGFQKFWVELKGEPEVLDIRFDGIESAEPTPEVRDALQSGDTIVIGPSNPITSIGPILALDGITEILKKAKVVVISPIIGDKPVSGPAGKFMDALGIDVSSKGILDLYHEIVDIFIHDIRDECELTCDSCDILRADTMMSNIDRAEAFARFVYEVSYN